MPGDMPDDVLAAIDVIGNNVRTEILRRLAQSQLTAHDLAERIGVHVGSVHRHLVVLEQHNLVTTDVDPERRDLRALRYCAGLSAAEVARAIHISTRSYARWESGCWARPPSADNVRAIARTLNVSVVAVSLKNDLAQRAERSRQSRPEA